MKIAYTVIAGTWEEFEGEMVENIKYCNSFDTMEEAEAEYAKHSRRPICRIEAEVAQ